ncbi:MAG: CCA tRNA nucleotidyltransferase [Phycisphaera sp.]|nr:CCA tRNA nucleotidyltransferase [Phycisphaera sp.]
MSNGSENPTRSDNQTVTPQREAAVAVVRALRGAGHEAYLAGGCVRDRLLGIEPKDHDVATSATPEEVRALFARCNLVGAAFGVALVRVSGHNIEVATFRAEAGYDDGRRPTRVRFTDAPHDAMRRDFTVNGLFEDPLATGESNQVLDYVGGVADIRARLVRAIGDPAERFAEDHLRMLRAPRFAARLGFEIEEKTARAIAVHARYLAQISRERIGMETLAMMAVPESAKRARAAALIQQLHLDGPTLNEDHHDAPLKTLGNLDDRVDAATALAAWAVDRHVDKPEPARFDRFVQVESSRVVRRWRKALCLSNETRDALAGTLGVAARMTQWGESDTAQKKHTLSSPHSASAVALLRALARSNAGFATLMARVDEQTPGLLAEGVSPQPWVTGEDLIAMGQSPGPLFGKLLQEAYDAQLNGQLTTRVAALAWLRSNLAPHED